MKGEETFGQFGWHDEGIKAHIGLLRARSSRSFFTVSPTNQPLSPLPYHALTSLNYYVNNLMSFSRVSRKSRYYCFQSESIKQIIPIFIFLLFISISGLSPGLAIIRSCTDN
jgi:hypothetical protein